MHCLSHPRRLPCSAARQQPAPRLRSPGLIARVAVGSNGANPSANGSSGSGATAADGASKAATGKPVPEALHLSFETTSPTAQAAKLAEAAKVAEQTKVLNLGFESERKAKVVLSQAVVKTTGLHRAPLSGGVKTATTRYDLPSPPVAVRNLVEHARFGHLCTMMSGMHHRRAGYPFGTLIDFAADGGGYPIFCLSPLAIHARNVQEESKCSLVVQMPGWTGLANARVTIFGDVYQLPAELQASARDMFIAKHANERKERWVSGNFLYFRMNKIVDIYFVGGFGTVQWIDPVEYLSASPDEIVLQNPTKILNVLNDAFAQDLRKLLVRSSPIDELTFISVDASGADIRVRAGGEFSVERIGFEAKVHSMEDAMSAVRKHITEFRRAME